MRPIYYNTAVGDLNTFFTAIKTRHALGMTRGVCHAESGLPYFYLFSPNIFYFKNFNHFS